MEPQFEGIAPQVMIVRARSSSSSECTVDLSSLALQKRPRFVRPIGSVGANAVVLGFDERQIRVQTWDRCKASRLWPNQDFELAVFLARDDGLDMARDGSFIRFNSRSRSAVHM